MSRSISGLYWLMLIGLAVLLVIYADRRDLISMYQQYEQSEQEVLTLREDLDELETEKESLERRVEHLGTTSLEMEAAIRRDKGLVREGEIVYQVELPEEASRDQEN